MSSRPDPAVIVAQVLAHTHRCGTPLKPVCDRCRQIAQHAIAKATAA